MAAQKANVVSNICCIGAGYVGGPTAAIIASKRPEIQVTVVDISKERIKAWNSSQLPIHEPGLQDIVREARDGLGKDRKPNLLFSTNVDSAIKEAGLIFLCVNTPTKLQGVGAGCALDLGAVELVVRQIAAIAVSDKIIVEKSTVPCRTADYIRDILSANKSPNVQLEVLSNPEFLAEGTAIQNLQNPDRVLIGSLTTKQGLSAASALAEVYLGWIPRDRIVTMNIWSSELSKIASNAILAQRISSINALSAICEATGADASEVSNACGLDKRIGPRMLKASMGFGGSCFKKDVLSLTYMAETLNLPEVAAYFSSIISINDFQKDRFSKKIISSMYNTLTNKKLAVLGFAYKKDTGDTRESAAITIVDRLVAEGAQISIYDPQVKASRIWDELGGCETKFEVMKRNVSICSSPYEACRGAQAVVIVTEWDEFNNKSESTISNLPSFQTHNSSEGATIENLFTDALSTWSINIDERLLSRELPKTPPQSPPDGPSVIETCSRSRKLDWAAIAKTMRQPMYVFDGRNVVDERKLEKLGFRVYAIGKPPTGAFG